MAFPRIPSGSVEASSESGSQPVPPPEVSGHSPCHAEDIVALTRDFANAIAGLPVDDGARPLLLTSPRLDPPRPRDRALVAFGT